MLTNLTKIKKYIELKNEIDLLFDNDIMKSTLTNDDLNNFKKRFNILDIKYQPLLKSKIENMEIQYNNITNLINSVKDLFVNEQYQDVKLDINRDNYNSVLNMLNQLKQEDIKNQQLTYLQKVEQVITQREIEYQRKLAEEKRQREIAIANAWVKLNVPYVSQNIPGVYNGCEVASLLMALKYKGYLGNIDMISYANLVPKSNDPHQGFVNDIFNLEPRDIVHWIAPDALASFGINSSGNSNVINSTGFNLDQLDNELNNNNLIVIYLTANLKKPKNWKGEIPGNLHVLVLSGYNKITGEHIITDPWTRKDGSYEWYISRSELESIYNGVGKKSVIVR